MVGRNAMVMGELGAMVDGTVRSGFGPFGIWKEQGLIRVRFHEEARIGIKEMKEVLRLLEAVDPAREGDVLLDQQALAQVSSRARDLARRACRGRCRPVAFLAHDLADRIQGNFFARFHKPRFPFRVVLSRNEALRWYRERRQVLLLGLAADRG